MIRYFFNRLCGLAALFVSVPVEANTVVTSTLPPPLTTNTSVSGTSATAEDIQYLTLALYFEGAPNESKEGLQGIASVIVNRVNSRYFPNTIKDVVMQGARGQTTGGCQFSFMCDPYPEDKELLCQLPKRAIDMQMHWGENGCQKRWDAYRAFAEAFLTHKEDNTGKALMYYAATMKRQPYWHVDLVKSSRVQRGSHLFFRSKRFKETEEKIEETVQHPTSPPP